jgi:F0F1-type ATP synthase epsilon subunit
MADEVDTPEVTTPEQTPDAHGGKPTIAAKVYAPFQVYFEGDAFSVSAVNATGPFDVLPHHHPFLCMLVPCNLTIRTVDGGQKTIKIHRALMHVKADRVVVFVDV